MTTFLTGNRYYMRSVCDHNCIWVYKVTKRTASTVTLFDEKSGETKTCRINKAYTAHRDAETVFPLGQYSMCPILSADHNTI